MVRRAPLLAALFAVLCACVIPTCAIAQDDPALKAPPADDHAAWVKRDVLKVIQPAPLDGETYTDAYELYEIRKGLTGIDYTPNFEAKTQTVYERAKEATLRRTIWALEFSFKPVRMIMTGPSLDLMWRPSMRCVRSRCETLRTRRSCSPGCSKLGSRSPSSRSASGMARCTNEMKL